MIDWAILVLRLGIGIMFFAHGLQMAFGLFGGPGISGFTQFLVSLGFLPARLWAYLAAYTTFIGGLCLILGIFTRGAASLLLIFIVVAAVKVHLAKGFFLQSGGFEYNFVIAAACIALIIAGAGKFGLTK